MRTCTSGFPVTESGTFALPRILSRMRARKPSISESRAWLQELGVQHVIDHHQPLAPQLEALGIDAVQRAVSLTHTDQHFAQLVEVLAPQGALALIDDPDPVAINVLALGLLAWGLIGPR